MTAPSAQALREAVVRWRKAGVEVGLKWGDPSAALDLAAFAVLEAGALVDHLLSRPVTEQRRALWKSAVVIADRPELLEALIPLQVGWTLADLAHIPPGPSAVRLALVQDPRFGLPEAGHDPELSAWHHRAGLCAFACDWAALEAAWALGPSPTSAVAQDVLAGLASGWVRHAVGSADPAHARPVRRLEAAACKRWWTRAIAAGANPHAPCPELAGSSVYQDVTDQLLGMVLPRGVIENSCAARLASAGGPLGNRLAAIDRIGRNGSSPIGLEKAARQEAALLNATREILLADGDPRSWTCWLACLTLAQPHAAPAMKLLATPLDLPSPALRPEAVSTCLTQAGTGKGWMMSLQWWLDLAPRQGPGLTEPQVSEWMTAWTQALPPEAVRSPRGKPLSDALGNASMFSPWLTPAQTLRWNAWREQMVAYVGHVQTPSGMPPQAQAAWKAVALAAAWTERPTLGAPRL